MAITQSGATVDTSARDEFLQSSVDSSITNGGETAHTQTTGDFLGIGGETSETGAGLGGVTANFVNEYTNAMDTYCSDIKTKIDALTKVEVNQAFKGEAVERALNKFVESVKEVATNYITKLQNAEQSIIKGVQEAYETQDIDLSSNLSNDGTSLTSSNSNN